MIKRAGWVAALALLGAFANAADLESRAPSEAERTGFHTFYQKQFPDNHAGQPVFAITRARGTEAWNLAASVSTPPQRGLKQLCRMRRIGFDFAPATKMWSTAQPARQFVWLDAGPSCRPAAQPVELLARMPDSELVGVLGQQAGILQRARLLMVGNSACASQRSYRFALGAIDIGTSGSSPEEMVGLVFRSDRATSATVWVRRSGADYDPWNVSC